MMPRYVRLDKGFPHHCAHCLDGGHALPAPPLRLSLRGTTRLKAVRDVQADGESSAQGHHQSCHDCDLAAWSVARLEGRLVGGRLAARETGACADAVGLARLSGSLGA